MCPGDFFKAAHYVWRLTVFDRKECLSEVAALAPLSVSNAIAAHRNGANAALPAVRASAPSFNLPLPFSPNASFAAGISRNPKRNSRSPMVLTTTKVPLCLSMLMIDRTEVLLQFSNDYEYVVTTIIIDLKLEQFKVKNPSHRCYHETRIKPQGRVWCVRIRL